MSKSRETRAATFKGQRDTSTWILHKKFNLNANRISLLYKKHGWKIERRAIADILLDKQKELLREEVEEEEIEENREDGKENSVNKGVIEGNGR